MINKIIGWTWIIWNIVAVFSVNTMESDWLLGLIFVVGNIYITAKFIEGLKS